MVNLLNATERSTLKLLKLCHANCLSMNYFFKLSPRYMGS